MTDKAYIVANEQQEREVLEKLERDGYLWRGTDMRPTEKHRLTDEPITIFARDDKRLTFDYKVNEAYLADYEIEIDFDGRTENKMSDKYVVSQEVMNGLKEWKNGLNINGQYYVDDEDIYDLSSVIENWWRDDTHALEQNNCLIAIIRWVNGEDVFEVEKPKKWVVRSKSSSKAGRHLYVMLDISHGVNKTIDFWDKDIITRFDTREEAESWANSHQEVIEVEI